MTKQYYRIQFRSPAYYQEDHKIIVNSFKELKEFVLDDLEDLMNYTFDEDVRITRRMHTGHMYRDLPNNKYKIVGKVLSWKRLRPSGYYKQFSDEEIGDKITEDQQYIEYWCERIPKKALEHFAGFEEVK